MPPKKMPIYIADAFTSQPFAGNPAAVCLLSDDIADELKQQIAAEMNLSETAFVIPRESTKGEGDPFATGSRFGLRWFTPTTEVPLCGHATLASASVLFYKRGNQQKLHFETVHSGVLTATRVGSMIEMELPLNPPDTGCLKGDPSIRHLASAAVGGEDLMPRVVEVELNPVTKKLVVRMEDGFGREGIESFGVMNGDQAVAIDTGNRVRGVIVTTRSMSTDYDFVSRYFAPWVGIPEDPVTGSAHTVLAPFWSSRLRKNLLRARQCSARGGELELEVRAEEKITAVRGSGTIVLEGTIEV